MDQSDSLTTEANFAALSITDLIEARDQYHVFLTNKPNVVATAIGLYRIRIDEKWPTKEEPSLKRAEKPSVDKAARTFSNSEVRPYSWPAVLVFVDNWTEESKLSASEVVPKTLFMQDGRRIPVCVIEAPKDATSNSPAQVQPFDRNLMRGGRPVGTTVQGQERIASIGCLVSDGHYTYALTNKHVTGEAGTQLYSVANGETFPIGTSSGLQLGKVPFSDVYPRWNARGVLCNLDIGLIKIEDVRRWTARIEDIGEFGKVFDLNSFNLTLRLIGAKVTAFGAVSGRMHAEIQGLLYRYKSTGGNEYVCDFLIGASGNETFETHHGDSGTLWLLKTENKPRPIAVQWGGHVLGSHTKLSYALATCLSTACRMLEVEPIADLNLVGDEYWGARGHYTIADKACDVVQNPKLKELMQNNRRNIAIPAEVAIPALTKEPFVPLADVPDMVWKVRSSDAIANRTPRENPNHFADMDRVCPSGRFKGQTLLDICKDPSNVSVDVWIEYYRAVGDKGMGLLPFRIWQGFEEMVAYVRAGDVERFVCAAGVLSHYLGDSCQPLHISYLHDGDPEDLGDKLDRHGNPMPRAAGVHEEYETKMINRNIAEIVQGLKNKLHSLHKLPTIETGKEAALEVIKLMSNTFEKLPPTTILDVYNEDKDSMWEKLGDDTISVMASGILLTAAIWESAWNVGKGDTTINSTRQINQDKLVEIYTDEDFLPSRTLLHVAEVLTPQKVLTPVS